MVKFKKLTLAIAFTGTLALAACGGGADERSNGSSGSDEDSIKQVLLDGSSTVYPIMEAVAEEYAGVEPDVEVSVGVSGSGGGFEKFTQGEIDISNASRPIKDEEAKAAKANGIEFTEFEIAYDGLSVVVNKDNHWVDKLTIDQLKQIWIEDGSTKKWSDIDPSWPDEEISFYSPGADSGTFDYFNEVILEDEPIVEGATLSEDDNVLVTGVAGDKNAIGYFGYAYYAENTDKLKVVPIVNPETDEAVKPTNDTIQSNEYAPLSRPLFIYVNNEKVKDEAIYNFVKYTLENAGELATDVGYVNLPKERYDQALSKLESLK
ncbi:PstS family phosphate ABC transporter substrate-binding protein [Caldibacillus thermolactis]|jgi:phosphate transport system substrate-binding protein|uniref:Phosphate-binding protein n=1 Tax=Pallidibacillus thermolactis TaxID=251051 RepID=A0ABT2WII9_9BACI|nr:PstS family phosphate ABC transporter substrate-binding protein [Pallidibacillus thermolactis]MCU9595468.1 PstS family phosphate ABC transporter substrate-binding protein [Pallidibacillus thermolactis]